jgi:hypothetical protein
MQDPEAREFAGGPLTAVGTWPIESCEVFHHNSNESLYIARLLLQTPTTASR